MQVCTCVSKAGLRRGVQHCLGSSSCCSLMQFFLLWVMASLFPLDSMGQATFFLVQRESFPAWIWAMLFLGPN